MSVVYTVGHSKHSEQAFVQLLHQHGVTAVADVRSSPYSRFNPQFNREALAQRLKAAGIAYVFLGAELGARTEDDACYEKGKVQYERLAQTDTFHRGLDRVVEGSKSYRIALMCAEKDPLDCHRTLLVARHLLERDMEVKHILASGSVETHEESLRRLLDLLSLPEQDMFRSREEIIADAYSIRGQAIAYDREATSTPSSTAEGESSP